MTYDGYLAAAAPGAAVVLDRDLNVKSYVTFSDEAVDNSIAVDEKNGIYVVTSKRMLRLVWTGSKLSTDEKDGAWASPYESIGDKALALGSISRGSGTTPTLMGFGDDPDKLVVISDAAEGGTNLVAFWREEIPADFKQKPGTLSRRIADQIRIDISKLTIEPSPNVLGYGVAVINGSYPEPVPGVPGAPNAFTAGVTRRAPVGVQKFVWNSKEHKFEKAWTNNDIDNSDIMVPVVSAATGLMYCANKSDGDYEYVGVDWNDGKIKQRWQFPDDSRVWNAFGGITTILEDGGLMIGGAFAVKRLLDSKS